MERVSFETPGIVITQDEALEFQELVNKIYKGKITINEATVMGSNLVTSLELISQNLFKMTDIRQENKYEHKSS